MNAMNAKEIFGIIERLGRPDASRILRRHGFDIDFDLVKRNLDVLRQIERGDFKFGESVSSCTISRH